MYKRNEFALLEQFLFFKSRPLLTEFTETSEKKYGMMIFNEYSRWYLNTFLDVTRCAVVEASSSFKTVSKKMGKASLSPDNCFVITLELPDKKSGLDAVDK